MCLCKQERWALLLTLTSPFQLHFGDNYLSHGVENNNNNKKKSAGEPKSCPAPAGAAPPPSSCHPEHRGSLQGGCLGQLIFFLALGRALPLSFFFFFPLLFLAPLLPSAAGEQLRARPGPLKAGRRAAASLGPVPAFGGRKCGPGGGPKSSGRGLCMAGGGAAGRFSHAALRAPRPMRAGGCPEPCAPRRG